MKNKPSFKQNPHDTAAWKELRHQVFEKLGTLPANRSAKHKVKVYLFLLSYVVAYIYALNSSGNFHFLFGYAFMGFSMMFIFLNIIHEAAHDTLFDAKWKNSAALFVLDLMGANSYIWKKRHVIFHHGFPNVDGWDSDVEQAGFVNIFPHRKSKWYQRFQHVFVFFLYPLYPINWLFVRDYRDFFSLNRIVRKQIHPPVIEYVKLFFFKSFFFFYMIIIPLLFGHDPLNCFLGMIVMLLVAGFLSVMVLLTPHVNISNKFHEALGAGLQSSWLQHQFDTTNDILLPRWLSGGLLGNFNFHLMHHLFPSVPAVHALEITEVIKDFAIKNGYRYRSYSLAHSLKLHYQLIKSNALKENIFEE